MESKGDVDEDDENNSLWMTSTQFSQLLDKQETLENMGYTLVNKKKSRYSKPLKYAPLLY